MPGTSLARLCHTACYVSAAWRKVCPLTICCDHFICAAAAAACPPPPNCLSCCQGAGQVVFVSSELDALALSAAGVPAIAVAQQTPSWKRQQHWQQQQQHQGHQQSHQHVEDPRLRLTGLAAELSQLQQQQNLKGGSDASSGGSSSSGSSSGGSSSSGSSGTSGAGLVVSDVSSSSLTGLSLLVPSANIAVIAMEQGPEGQAVGGSWPSFLGRWPAGKCCGPV